MALQEASEAYLVGLFEDTNLCVIHAKRLTKYISKKTEKLYTVFPFDFSFDCCSLSTLTTVTTRVT
ncbi:histone H3, embryonic [Armadillidium vulgare]|nr:histone H3, embryonic [Armadillidium vulgare]